MMAIARVKSSTQGLGRSIKSNAKRNSPCSQLFSLSKWLSTLGHSSPKAILANSTIMVAVDHLKRHRAAPLNSLSLPPYRHGRLR